MKRILRAARHRWLFSLAVVAIIAGLILQVTKQHTAAHWVLGTVAIFEVLPLLYGMWQDVRSGKYGIDILAATAIIASVLLHQTWAAMIVVLMLTGGESLEDYAEHKSKAELDALLKRAPQQAHVLRKGKTISVPVDELKVGEKILIKPGEVVPVDCQIIEGLADFDESSLTGESLPHSHSIGDQILSGSICSDGAITAKVITLAADSQYQQIIRLVRSASQSQAPYVRLADRYSIPFTFAAYAIASTVWVMSGHAIRFLEVIIVATPCPLLLAAPIALISGMARASKYGIIVKNGSALEKFADAKTIVFDKTGTLTRGELQVESVITYAKQTKDEVLALAASLEQSSNHILAQAIVAGATAQNLKVTKAKHVKEFAGRGVKAQVKGQEVLVGRLSLLQEHDVTIPKDVTAKEQQKTAAFVAIGTQLIGAIYLQDEARPETENTLIRLKKLGIKNIAMVTGDNKVVAESIAAKLGITQVYADMLPADKLHILETIKGRPLIFVGDGVNDAPALTSSDVGIALGARGSTAASESADIVIMADDLSRVADALAIAKRTFRIASQSIIAGILLSLVLMIAFATGKFPPLAGAILQEVVDVVVIFNALRAHLNRVQF